MQFALSDRTRCRSESLNAEFFGISYFPPPSLSRRMFSRANKKLSLHTFLSGSGGGMARAEKNSENSSSGNMKRKVPLASYSLGKYSIFQLFAPTFPSSVAFFSARNGNFLSFSPSCINFSFDRRSLRKAFIFLSFIWFRLDLLERRRRRFGCLSSHIYMSRISSFTRSTRIFYESFATTICRRKAKKSDSKSKALRRLCPNKKLLLWHRIIFYFFFFIIRLLRYNYIISTIYSSNLSPPTFVVYIAKRVASSTALPADARSHHPRKVHLI